MQPAGVNGEGQASPRERDLSKGQPKPDEYYTIYSHPPNLLCYRICLDSVYMIKVSSEGMGGDIDM
jgi:hypothetical protein